MRITVERLEELERGYQYLYRKTALLCGDKTIII